MSCCDETTVLTPVPHLTRRSMLKGAAAVAGALAATSAHAQGKSIKLAFCSQLLCIVPYEVARAAGHFRDHGLEVELVYTRGGSAAMQALVGGAVDYAATSLDVALQAYARGADIRRFITTGRLPLFALVTAPKKAPEIQGPKDLEGKTVGISALGNADHALVLYVLAEAGADPKKVRFATLGPNLLEALRQGQVDAGAVQEPALTLLEKDGARILVNGMDLADARKYFGGPYEFMGVAARAKEIGARKDEMVRLARALEDALKHLQAMTADQLVAALPREIVAGSDVKQLGEIVARHRAALYPTEVAIDLDASKRVAASLKAGGLLKPDANVTGLFDTSIVRG